MNANHPTRLGRIVQSLRDRTRRRSTRADHNPLLPDTGPQEAYRLFPGRLTAGWRNRDTERRALGDRVQAALDLENARQRNDLPFTFVNQLQYLPHNDTPAFLRQVRERAVCQRADRARGSRAAEGRGGRER